MHLCILSVGSNIHPFSMVYEARNILSKEHQLLGCSKFNKTKPVGFQDQDDFLNGAFMVQTLLNYMDFNAYLKTIENRLGRIKTAIKSGPRTIDLDIIIWDGEVVHPDYSTNDYIKIPVQELIDDYYVQLTS
ncbi:MAG: 2-amino-4-hydroxy-6-hydroxymethyldihydropteridine diphosphokinase [Tatlockia sp.]|nr:2-amino-4-hydroxy-6-hydroxymethyldihydropteridine diphosphokinase [Tatlockia sp.]